jgi:hypothetical protein
MNKNFAEEKRSEILKIMVARVGLNFCDISQDTANILI